MQILLPTQIEELAALILLIFHGGGVAKDAGCPGSRHTPASADYSLLKEVAAEPAMADEDDIVGLLGHFFCVAVGGFAFVRGRQAFWFLCRDFVNRY